MKEKNVPTNLIGTVKDFLENGVSKIRIGDKEVVKKSEMGCPQGSKSGPKLWNIFYNEILKVKLEEGTEKIIFADDTLLITRDKTWKGVKAKTDKIIARVMKWADDNLIEINKNKTGF